MKYAMIGCGRISKNHLKAAIDNDLDIVALCDIDINKIEYLIRELDYTNSIFKYFDYKQMLQEHPEIELVAIATNSGKHAEIALYCIDKGINVIIEKPMALSIKDAEEIIRRSKINGVKVTACHQNRYNLAVLKTRKAVEEKRLGNISHGSICVRWNRNEDYYKQASWRGKWEDDGGCLFNQCIHGIDLLCWLIDDDAIEVYGVTKNQQHSYIETEDIGMAIVKFKNGTIASIEGTVNVYPNNLEETLYLFGDKGTIKIGGTSTNSIDVWNITDEKTEDLKNNGLIEVTDNVYGNGHVSIYKNMIDAINEDVDLLVTPEDAKKVIELILAIYKSSREDKAITLPLKEGSSIDYKGMFD